MKRFPRFLIPIALLDLYACHQIYTILNQEPSAISQVYWLLFWIFLAFSITLALPIFFNLRKKTPPIPNERPIFRRALKIASLITLGPILYLALRAANLASLINTGLLATLYVMILFRLRHQQHA
uniref:Uncharacterized protein n=1 Tax=candidate division WWE3 bacterium TaxID=2053526 RepID=A0A7C4XML3_UNCKA